MKKKSQVVMLTANEKAPFFIDEVIGLIKAPQDRVIPNLNYQHLYILSDEKIKEGDWCYKKDLKGNIFKWINTENDWYKDAKKIIATNNNKISMNLGKEKWIAPTNSSYDQVYIRLSPFPQPSKQFIEYYIYEYNKGNIITEVEVEYEDNGEEGWIGDNYNGEPFWNEKLELKVNPDNTINIYPIKNSWNREEFEIAIRETWRVACSDTYKALSPELEDEWVNEILK